MSNTTSTVEIYKSLRAILLAYVSPSENRLRDFIGAPEQVYVRATPANPTFPYVALILDAVTTPGFNTYRETMRLEVQIVGRPESQLPNCENAMDLVDQCLLSLLEVTDGLMFCRNRERQTVPMFTDASESNIVVVRSTYDLVVWPSVLTVRR